MEKSSQSCFVAVLCISKYAPLWGSSLWKIPKYVDFSVLHLQSDSPALGVWIKIWILAVFFNQRYELGPKATISTCSQVVSIMLSGELSDSIDSPFLFSAEGTEIAFSSVYIYFGNMWVVLKRTKFLLQARKSGSPLFMYSSG